MKWASRRQLCARNVSNSVLIAFAHRGKSIALSYDVGTRGSLTGRASICRVL